MRLIELTSHIVFDVEEVSVCTLHDGDDGFIDATSQPVPSGTRG